MKKPLTVYVLSERMPGEEWLTVSVYASKAGAEEMARTLAEANGPTHETRLESFNVVPEAK